MFVRKGAHNPAQRRYVRRFVPGMLGYVGLLLVSTWAIRAYHPEGALLFLLALLPALPLVAVIGVMGLYLVEERDEFIRNRLIVAMIGGLGILLALTTIWGFLEDREVVPHFPTFLSFPIWCGCFGLFQCFLSLRDRLAGGGE
ncbi:hypothetical protein FHS95_003976 [Sphingomonas naasensis]|uniref:Uncharacterized protein n=1 Tax=Sphingomonas naasensis TaxID=1344951 RepID=A0A4S1WIJ1_9SPHN|nr:hypothetical protein [Sphingomonas naasensis]NIJ22261.1 hypothetical protein [Sphingomonas naasensis]TGX40726.1 hypothetical protein E5A74_14650 [Sphingomonas naasensis]